jgi:hypothetical protein
MTRAFRMTSALLLVAVVVVAGGCSSGGTQSAETQEKFGVRMARMNLWREALFRFQRAVEMNPADALAHNNLAVAYEANGDFDKALREYREAIRLDKSNQYIQKNYSRFVEFTARNRKRQQRTTPATRAAATETPAGGAPASSPAPTPVTGADPAKPAASDPAGTAPPGSVTSPAPAGTAPASTAPPNPQPQPVNPPGGQS